MKTIVIPGADTEVEIYPDHAIVRYVINWKPFKEKTVRYKTPANASRGIRKKMEGTVLESEDVIEEALVELEREEA